MAYKFKNIIKAKLNIYIYVYPNSYQWSGIPEFQVVGFPDSVKHFHPLYKGYSSSKKNNFG